LEKIFGGNEMFGIFMILVAASIAIGCLGFAAKIELGGKPIKRSFDDTTYWTNDEGNFHRLDGPAVERPNGVKEWYRNGLRHREDGPAIEHSSGRKEWYVNGMVHRTDGPALEYSNGDKHWYQNGKRHRLDGPAVEFVDGTKHWYIDNQKFTEQEFLAGIILDRTQPSSSSESTMTTNGYGTKFWLNSKGHHHRTDGPAVEYTDGRKEWWVNGKQITQAEKEFLARNQPNLYFKYKLHLDK